MPNKPTTGQRFPDRVRPGRFWQGAAALSLVCGTTFASSDNNTALLARSDLVPDGSINWKDLNAFLSAFAQMDLRADITGDGNVDGRDTTAFLGTMGSTLGTPPQETPMLSVAATTPRPKGRPSAPPPASAPSVQTPTGAYSVAFVNGVLDFVQGNYTIMHQASPVWRAAAGGGTPQVSMVEKSNGFDLIFRMNNTGRHAQKLGSVVLEGFRLGQALKVRDFRAAGVDIAMNDPAAAPMREGLSYPSEWYSPVMVLQSDIYTLGVSLEYPILDYKHEVRLSVEDSASSHEQKLVIEFNDRDGPVGYSREGELQSHEERQYVVSVRVLPASEERWMSVLEPYKEYFTQLYGGPEYERDPRPVHATVMASPSMQNQANPNGYLYYDLRPDMNGFGPWVDELEQRTDLGWERFMLWRTTGMPTNARGQSNGWCSKFEMASPFLAEGPMHDALTELPRFDNRGRQLGMWWSDPLHTENRSRTDDFDPTDSRDVEDALREAQTAALAGAEMIGLERFNSLPAWEAYPWLHELRAATPGVTYITEPACGDLLHTLAGAFMIAEPDSSAPSTALDTRFFLADYLLPGHETWGLIRVDRLGAPTDNDIRGELMRLADNGYVPVVVPPIDVDRRVVAEETWRDPAW